MHIPGYPKVYAIGHSAIKSLFDGSVIVEEKVDGSQISFCKVGGRLVMRSRNADIYTETAGMFQLAVSAVSEMLDSLREGWVYRGEYLSKPKHNTLEYSRTPLRHIILFDINPSLNEEYLTRDQKEAEASRIGLEIVPILYSGEVEDRDKILSFLTKESILGKAIVEGVVVKNYSQFSPDGKAAMGKYVRQEFKEDHGKNWKAANPAQTDIMERIVETLKTEARWEKAVQHLREAGVYDGSPRDIGNLMKEVANDIRAEEQEFIKQKLYQWAIEKITRGVTAGLPEWYKAKLLETAFEAKP